MYISALTYKTILHNLYCYKILVSFCRSYLADSEWFVKVRFNIFHEILRKLKNYSLPKFAVFH